MIMFGHEDEKIVFSDQLVVGNDVQADQTRQFARGSLPLPYRSVGVSVEQRDLQIEKKTEMLVSDLHDEATVNLFTQEQRAQ